MTSARPRVAVVGSGPSGLYAAAALAASDTAVDVDVLDRLPAPYGLVRYGVAPDHVKMKSVIRVLARPFGPGEVRFLGGVTVGPGPDAVPLPVLREHYTAVVHASGSALDRRLGIPGEDLPGSIGSGAMVGWYCGHPDHGVAPRLDVTLVLELGRLAADHLAHRRARHRQPPHDLLDRPVLLEIRAPYLPDQVHANHPPSPSQPTPA